MFGSLNCHHKPVLEKTNMDNPDYEKGSQLGSMKKKSANALTKLRNSLSKKGRRSSKVMPLMIQNNIGSAEMQAVHAFRQAPILDKLLPSKLDNPHTLLR